MDVVHLSGIVNSHAHTRMQRVTPSMPMQMQMQMQMGIVWVEKI